MYILCKYLICTCHGYKTIIFVFNQFVCAYNLNISEQAGHSNMRLQSCKCFTYVQMFVCVCVCVYKCYRALNSIALKTNINISPPPNSKVGARGGISVDAITFAAIFLVAAAFRILFCI